MSVKELYKQKGMLSTCGSAAFAKRYDVDSENFLPLVEAGAIVLVRGNVPQAALSIHSENYIWGCC
jgi:Asp-tRNA(Asn)/Glu-tRNA(Gln) amidotransferase A subunit family amidase